MVGFGIYFMFVMWPIVTGQWPWGGSAWIWVQTAFWILLVVAGISVFRRRAYWWALLAAIGMIVVGTVHAGRLLQDPMWGHPVTATQWLLAARSWAILGVPGLLALIFLVKRKAEFAVSPEA